MQVMPTTSLLSELHRTASWELDASRTPIEHLVEYLLTGSLATGALPEIDKLAQQVLRFNLQNTRVVVLGGGTGLSTIVGGNSQMPDWPEQLNVGLKQDFSHLSCVVCTTDDGGSTGRLLKSLPLIGIGDLRKLLISSILPKNLQRIYSLGEPEAKTLARLIHNLFNHRFHEQASGLNQIANPLLVAPSDLRIACPKPLADSLRELGAYISPGGSGPVICPAGHALGNLLLAAAIFMAANGRANRPPGLNDIQRGIDHVAFLIGAPVKRIHAATATPGQLKFRYANGVDVYGQSKSAQSRRDSPVERVLAVFIRKPEVSAAVLSAITDADLILYAPGSLYTSIIPILQLEPITKAIRSNRKALKVLAANSWIQEGETDISLKNQGRGFLVSELIEAYDRNIPHGIRGLFHVVLSANLEHVPGNILRNYALEGKSPIHLDRVQVEATGVQPIEATLFSPERQKKTRVIHHDARRFSLAIRTLLYADKCLKNKNGYSLRRSKSRTSLFSGDSKEKHRALAKPIYGTLLCNYMKLMAETLRDKDFRPEALREFLLEVVWQNRDIPHSHLKFFRGVRVIPEEKWNRSTEWDNILGYFDPEDGYIKLHKDLLANPSTLQKDFLIALGESLLGPYIENRRWIELNGSRCYEITIGPADKQRTYLTDTQLHTYLRLAQMIPDPTNHRIYRIMTGPEGGFLPPGLLFGLLYAWYLSGRGLTMEYEMTLLRWSPKSLIPLHAKDRARKQALVTFFREEIFGHND
jgi:uncharacterized cofD-like protein